MYALLYLVPLAATIPALARLTAKPAQHEPLTQTAVRGSLWNTKGPFRGGWVNSPATPAHRRPVAAERNGHNVHAQRDGQGDFPRVELVELSVVRPPAFGESKTDLPKAGQIPFRTGTRFNAWAVGRRQPHLGC